MSKPMRFQKVGGLGGCISICELFFEVKTRVLTGFDSERCLGPDWITHSKYSIPKY